MNVKILCGALILGVSVIAAPTPSPGQSDEKSVSAPKPGGTSPTKGAAKEAPPNTNTNPTKHRHWRHQGGRHPHYGSRRVRIQARPDQSGE